MNMQAFIKYFLLFIVPLTSLVSCSTLEKASLHGFDDGYYSLKSKNKSDKVYIDISEEAIAVYPVNEGITENRQIIRFPSLLPDSVPPAPVNFKKISLDIDASTVLLKYRFNADSLPSELATDLNLALYAGPRFDYFKVKTITDPLGNSRYKVSNRGFDFGLLAGIGSTPVGPFSTQNAVVDEYNGMYLQMGIAGFVEFTFVSFGLSIGYDYLLDSHREEWIYRNRPWLGLVIGVALK